MQSKSGFEQEFKRLQRDLKDRIREIEEAINAGKASPKDTDVIDELNALKRSDFKIKEFLETLTVTGNKRWKEIEEDMQEEIKKAQQLLEQEIKSIKNR